MLRGSRHKRMTIFTGPSQDAIPVPHPQTQIRFRPNNNHENRLIIPLQLHEPLTEGNQIFDCIRTLKCVAKDESISFSQMLVQEKIALHCPWKYRSVQNVHRAVLRAYPNLLTKTEKIL